jgi:hypothetical protein
MFLRGKVGPMIKAENLTAICELFYRKCGILNVSHNYEPPETVTMINLFYLMGCKFIVVCDVTPYRSDTKMHEHGHAIFNG